MIQGVLCIYAKSMKFLTACVHACTVLEPLIREHGPAQKLLPTVTDSAFHALANVVISQQLSIHSAKAISDRVAAAAGVCLDLFACMHVQCGLPKALQDATNPANPLPASAVQSTLAALGTAMLRGARTCQR